MKKLAFLALSVVASAAMAAGPAGVQTTIAGTSVQAAVLQTSTVTNLASGVGSQAQQNLASNAGDVNIAAGGLSIQVVASNNSSFTNTAGALNEAQQNVSSNSGDVTISGNSLQITLANGSNVTNTAVGIGAKAVQSIASNASCSTCL